MNLANQQEDWQGPAAKEQVPEAKPKIKKKVVYVAMTTADGNILYYK